MTALIFHIVCALGSVAFSTLTFFRPTQERMYTNYFLIFATLFTGTYLVVSTHANMLNACVSGLSYTVVVAGILWAANRKLAASKVRSNK